ncbi:hypothetical protein [Vagococcus allomyrinae]|nr:hypothetical protein [Vagococcus allomyrinae]
MTSEINLLAESICGEKERDKGEEIVTIVQSLSLILYQKLLSGAS